MSGLSEKIKTKQKVKTFTGKRLSKISEEIDTEMVAENAEDRRLDMTEGISEDKTEDRTENIAEDRTEDQTEGQSEMRTEARSVERADTEEIRLSDAPDGTSRIENVQINPFGKLGTSIIIFLIFAGILSLIAIQIHSRAKNDFDDISTIFKFKSLLAATLRNQFEIPT